MSAFNKYQTAVEKLTESANIGTDTWRIILSNTAPDAATDTNQASASELTTSDWRRDHGHRQYIKRVIYASN